jgi:hypothetical protein
MKVLDEIRLAEPNPCWRRPRCYRRLKLAAWRRRLSSTRDFGGLQVCRDHSTSMATTSDTSTTAFARLTKKI